MRWLFLVFVARLSFVFWKKKKRRRCLFLVDDAIAFT